jgi:SAM-dependent methyltransferase
MASSGGYEDAPWLPEMYDFVPAYAGRPDVDFYVRYATEAGGPVLELGCGTGRVLIPTAQAGCELVGLDLAQNMLARCREKLRAQPTEVRSRVRLVQGDMREFDLGRTFALITTPFRPFQHLITVEDQMACLSCVRRHLSAGGRFILDLFHPHPEKLNNPALHAEQEDTAAVVLPDGRKLRRTYRIVAFHRAEQYSDVELIYYVTNPDGRTERLVHGFPFRYLFRYEVEHLLARAGFRVAELFGGFDRSSLRDDSPEMIFVAVKEGRGRKGNVRRSAARTGGERA